MTALPTSQRLTLARSTLARSMLARSMLTRWAGTPMRPKPGGGSCW